MSDPVPPSGDVTVQARPRQGKCAKQRQELKFRMKKNQDFQAALQKSLMAKLGVKDPTDIDRVKSNSSIVASRIPVVLKAIPKFLDEVWKRM